MVVLRREWEIPIYVACGQFPRQLRCSCQIGIEQMTSSTPKAKSRPKDDDEQSKRFLKAAQEAEADETEEGANKAFRTAVGKPKPPKDR